MEPTSTYRADIDGLRAVAVLAVVFYHVGFADFSGGFVGVDVFFVISGYLITNILVAEHARTGQIDFVSFYERRVRRIVPALAATCAVTLIVAALLMAPEHLAGTAQSVVASLFGVANILFWTQSGYFDTAADLKPLLHTWSLGVEEQFYLLWPIVLLACLNTSRAVAPFFLLIPLFVLSLAANYWAAPGFGGWPMLTEPLADGGSIIFFLMPFRVFEFAIGAALVWVNSSRWSNLTHEILLIVGLSFISWSVLTFSSDMLFPAHNALIPCAGAALVILGGRAKFTGLLLRNPLVAGIGLISYSLYLVHWPVIVFVRYATLDPLNALSASGVLALSVLLAICSYKFVEQPFRRPGSKLRLKRRPLFISCLMTAVVVGLPAVSASSGWHWRIAASGTLESIYNVYGGEDCVGLSCEHGTQGKPIVVTGDSFSKQLYEGLTRNFPEQRFIFVNHHLCTFFSPDWVRMNSRPDHVADCLAKRERFYELVGANGAEKVIIANNWIRDRYFSVAAAKEGRTEVIHIQRNSKELAQFIVQEVEALKEYLGLEDILIIANPPSLGPAPDLSACLGRPLSAPSACRYTDLVDVQERRHLASEPTSLPVLDPFDAFCNADHCANYDERGFYYSDNAHLSKLGSIVLVDHFRDRLIQWIGD